MYIDWNTVEKDMKFQGMSYIQRNTLQYVDTWLVFWILSPTEGGGI